MAVLLENIDSMKKRELGQRLEPFLRYAFHEHMPGITDSQEEIRNDSQERLKWIEYAESKLAELKSRVAEVGNECRMDVAMAIWPLAILGVLVTDDAYVDVRFGPYR